VGDELEGAVTKVVTFGAFVEIMDGVEGLVHISELAQHHVENPREVVEPGDKVKVKVLEIDSERRRLSLSVKRVEGQQLAHRTAGVAADGQPTEGAPDLDDVPELGLSEDVFAGPEVTVEGSENLRAAVQESADAEANALEEPEAAAEPAPEAPEEPAPEEAEQPEEPDQGDEGS
jgi:small subunit ribosomal protein S1